MDLDISQLANLGIGTVVASVIFWKIDRRVSEVLQEMRTNNVMTYNLLRSLSGRQDTNEKRLYRLESTVFEDDDPEQAPDLIGFRGSFSDENDSN